MEINVEIILVLVTSIITFAFGFLSKKFGWIDKNYIPLQNMVIGLFAGLMCYLLDLNTNLVNSITVCLISSMGAGGIYDLKKVKEEK